MLPEQPNGIKIAIFYHQKDAPVFEGFSDHLALLRRKKLIEQLSEPSAGSYRKEQIQNCINEAKVIVLLVSSSFQSDANDNYYGSTEMLNLIEARAKKGAKVWPIIIRSIAGSIFENYEVFFGEREKVLASWSPQDEGYRVVTEKINREIVQMLSEEWVNYSNTCYHQNNLAEALQGYEKSLSNTLGYPPALLGKLRVFLKQGKQEEAEWCFQNISSTNKQHSPHACIKGYALLELGRLFEAQKAFQDVYLQLAPLTNESQRHICADAYCGEGDIYLNLATPPSINSVSYYNQALAAYNNAGKLRSDSPKHLLGIGKTYIALGKFAQSDDYYKSALDVYEQIIVDYPKDVSALVGKGDALYGLRHFQESLEIYDIAKKIDPYEVGIYSGAGLALLKIKNYKDALTQFKIALHFDIKNKYYLYGKGQAQAGLKLYQEALDTFREAKCSGYTLYDLSVDQAEVLLNLADTEYIIARHSRAKAFYNEARELFELAGGQGWRDYYSQYFGLGRSYFGCKNWDSAFFFYEKAKTLRSSSVNAYLGMGKTKVELGSYKEAENCMASAQSLYYTTGSKIDEVNVMSAYGYLYYNAAEEPGSQNYYKYQQTAYECYKRATSIGPNAESFMGLGKVSMALNRYDEAINAFDQALAYNSLIAECWFLKGQCYYKLREFAEARKQYQLVIDSDVDSISVYSDLGDALLAMSNYFDALNAFDIEIKQGGKNIKHAYYGKGIAFSALGNNKEALLNFDIANNLDTSICSIRECRDALENIKYSIEGKLGTNLYDTSIYKQKGDVLRLLGERNEYVINAYTIAIENGHASADVYYYRGRAYFILQNYESSLSDYEEALRLEPNHQKAQQGKNEAGSMLVPKHKGLFEKFLNFWNF